MNCSKNKNVIIVGDAKPESMELVKTILGQQNLEQAVKKNREEVNPQTITLQSKKFKKKDFDEDQNKIAMAILSVASKSFDSFLPADLDLSHKEGWGRLMAAGYLAGIDLSERFSERVALEESEHALLQKKIEVVKKFGSSAAFLWKFLKTEKIRDVFDLQRLRNINSINDAQLKILGEAFDLYGRDQLLEKGFFSELEPKLQCIFIKAAQKFHPVFLEKRSNPHTPWTTDLPQDPEVAPPFRDNDDEKRPETTNQDPSPKNRRVESKELKFRDVNPEFEQLLIDLTVQNEKLPPDKIYSFTILKIKILCFLCNINIKKVDSGKLSSQEIRTVRKINLSGWPSMRMGAPTSEPNPKKWNKLFELQGTMQHIFHSLKRTIVKAELINQYGFTEQIYKYLIEENRTHNEFILDIHRAPNLFSLRIYALALLFKISERFSLERQVYYNGKYPLEIWFSFQSTPSSLERTPSSLTDRDEYGPSGAPLEQGSRFQLADNNRTQNILSILQHSPSKRSPETPRTGDRLAIEIESSPVRMGDTPQPGGIDARPTPWVVREKVGGPDERDRRNPDSRESSDPSEPLQESHKERSSEPSA